MLKNESLERFATVKEQASQQIGQSQTQANVQACSLPLPPSTLGSLLSSPRAANASAAVLGVFDLTLDFEPVDETDPAGESARSPVNARRLSSSETDLTGLEGFDVASSSTDPCAA